MADHIKLLATPVHQDSILLQGPSGLPPIKDRNNDTVLCIAYSLNRRHAVQGTRYENEDPNEDPTSRGETADGNGEAYKSWLLDHFYARSNSGGRVMHFEEADFPELIIHPVIPPANPNHLLTPPHSALGNFPDFGVIRVLDFKGCSAEVAGDLIATKANRPVSPNDPVFDSAGLENRKRISTALAAKVPHLGSPDLDGFITGISLRASSEGLPFFTLFISIPSLGIPTPPPTPPPTPTPTPEWDSTTTATTVGDRLAGSRTLREYRLQQISKETIDSTSAVLVHQTWFFVFDSVQIALFRSRDDTASNYAPLYPYQSRTGVFLAVVNMIANTLTFSEDAALKQMGVVIAALEFEIHRQIDQDEKNDAHAVAVGLKKKDRVHITESKKKTHDLIMKYESCILDVSTMMRVVRSQIQYLGQLQKVFQNSYGDRLGDTRPHKNSFKIPHIHGRMEEMSAAIATLKSIVEERESAFRELEMWESDLKFARSLFVDRNEKIASTGGAEATVTAIRKQGQTISLFTLITTIFVPLGFFCAYISMNPDGFESTITKQWQFWTFAAPITGVLTAMMSVFLFTSDDRMKRAIAKVYRLPGLRDKKPDLESQAGSIASSA